MKNSDLKIYTYGNSNAKPLIFVHGFPLNSGMWENQTRELSSDFFVVTYDLRGLGKSPVPQIPYTMFDHADDLLTIIRELDLKEPIIGGLSMGGYILQAFLMRHDFKPSGIILTNTRANADDNVTKLRRSNGIGLIRSGKTREFIKDFIPTCFCEKTKILNPDIVEKLIESNLDSDPAGVAGALFAMLSRPDTTEFVKSIDIPTLVIGGSDDLVTPASMMEETFGSIKNVSFNIIPDSGHLSPIEKGTEFNEIVRKFFKNF